MVDPSDRQHEIMQSEEGRDMAEEEEDLEEEEGATKGAK